MKFKDPSTSEKLSQMLVGVGAFGASAAAGLPLPADLASGAVAGSWLWSTFQSHRRADAARVMQATSKEIEAHLAEWVKSASHTDERDVAAAVASFEEVIVHCAPHPKDVVGLNLNAGAIALLVLKRAEEHCPAVYKETIPQSANSKLARGFLIEIVRRSYAGLIGNKDFTDQLTGDLWQESLTRLKSVQVGQEGLKAGQKDIKADLQDIKQIYHDEISYLKETLHAREADLVALLARILDQHVPKENIISAVEASHRKLTELRNGLSNLATLANEEPEIAPLLQDVRNAIENGEEFALERAETALSQATVRYRELNSERSTQLKRGLQNEALLLGRQAELADFSFRYEDAVSLYQQQIECLLDALDRRSAPEDHNRLAGAHMNKGNVLQGLQRLDEAVAAYDAAIGIMSDLRGRLGEATPPAFLNDLAGAHMNKGVSLRGLQRLDEAVAAYDAAIAIMSDLRNRLGEATPPAFLNDLAGAHMNKGNVLQGLQRIEETKRSFQTARDFWKFLAEAYPQNTQYRLWLERVQSKLEGQ